VRTLLPVLGFFVLAGAVAYLGITRQPVHAVTRIVDGDTIELSNGTIIRIQGIDAPESGQPYGKEAKEALAPIIGYIVSYKPYDTDKYGRTVARVYVEGIDIGLSQIKRGYAWHYAAYDASSDYASAEQDARAARLGLWGDPAPVPPWEWRAVSASVR
jgi:micrococcal nuclease